MNMYIKWTCTLTYFDFKEFSKEYYRILFICPINYLYPEKDMNILQRILSFMIIQQNNVFLHMHNHDYVYAEKRYFV